MINKINLKTPLSEIPKTMNNIDLSIKEQKTILSNILKSKGVSATDSERLENLIKKIGSIPNVANVDIQLNKITKDATFEEIALCINNIFKKINQEKEMMANTLNSFNINSQSSEKLSSLIEKINQITIEKTKAKLLDGQSFNSNLKKISNYNNVTTLNINYNTDLSSIKNNKEYCTLNSTDSTKEILGTVNGTILNIDTNAASIELNSDCTNMFNGFSSLTKIDLSSIESSNIIIAKGMFSECKSVSEINISGWNTPNLSNLNDTFYNCNALKNILGINDINTSNVTTMKTTFQRCGFEELDLSKWDTDKVTDSISMFHSCRSLKTLDLRNFNMKNNFSKDTMFGNCPLIKTIYISNNFGKYGGLGVSKKKFKIV